MSLSRAASETCWPATPSEAERGGRQGRDAGHEARSRPAVWRLASTASARAAQLVCTVAKPNSSGAVARLVGGEGDHAVASPALGQVHGPVGLVEQLLLEVGVGGVRGHADADREVRLLAERRLDAGDLAPDALGHLGGGLGVGAEQDHGELLAAVARRQVDVADGAVDDAGDAAQRVVARAVAVSGR